MSHADDIREQQRQTWDRFSRGWEKWDRVVLPMLQPVGDEMLRLLAVCDDAHHLDVASGTGEPGLSIAQSAARGTVVLTDPAAGMLDVATRSAAARGIRNVEFRVCGADELPFADHTFDSISCRFGFMFFPDIARAVVELKRVLKPGGRLCTAVWAEPAGNPWATIPMAAIATETELPPTTPDAPGLFRCAAPGVIGDALAAAGFEQIDETDVRASLTTTSVDEYWDYMTDVAAPVIAGLAPVDDDGRARIRSIVDEEAGAFEVDGQLQLPLHARCIVGTAAPSPDRRQRGR